MSTFCHIDYKYKFYFYVDRMTSKVAMTRLSKLNENWIKPDPNCFKPDLNWIRLSRIWSLPREFGNSWKQN
jgi:hypothetical protein